MKKPKWVVEKEQAKKATAAETIWLFGLHAVGDALRNPQREKLRLLVTKNAADRLQDAIAQAGIEPEIQDPRKFSAPIDAGSVHQGAAIEVRALNWGSLESCVAPTPENPTPLIVLLDRVTDPHNVGAILRSAEVFGAQAVIAPQRHAAPETGALAKTASGALERQPYFRVQNLANSMQNLQNMGYLLLGLDGLADTPIEDCANWPSGPTGIVLGAEGPGLRNRTKETCDALVKISAQRGFGSLNVSNAAAVALYSLSRRL